MDRLRGKTILIGKEPGQGRLLVNISGSTKSIAIGAPGSVPNSVSRCKPAEGVAHAKITIDSNGVITVFNAKPQNVTYVNGSEIASKRVEHNCSIELGKDRFAVDLSVILNGAIKLLAVPSPAPHPAPQPAPRPVPAHDLNLSRRKFNISHLEHIWYGHLQSRKAILANQKKINLVRSGCGMFTMCAMPCIFFFGPVGYLLTGIGLIGNLYSFVGLKNDDTADAIERLNEDFQERYVCPNPDCNKFLGNISYRLLKKQHSMHCPYCKCEYVER